MKHKKKSLLILAGGLGTRLRDAIPDLPKPMAPIGNNPFLKILIDYWITQEIKEIILLVGYKYEKILNAVVHFNKNKIKPSNIFGDGKVSKRIFGILKKLN